MSRLIDHRVSRTALLEMQGFALNVICPDIPILEEVEKGECITMEHVSMMTQALKDITGKDLRLDVSTLLEVIFFPLRDEKRQ
ncbi:hypothetical protein ACOJA0_08670 [Corynebacterium amycolatum]|uniref:hypothetical protein n=1 Tax=Corynebacterium TaxID=1716 RepID=UPI000664F074|nr:hypothetical protein [Corynebacterium sp. 239_CJEI]